MMNQWQDLIHYGNACFYQQDWYSAEAYYLDAAFSLNQLIEMNNDNSEILMAWVSAMHSLAVLFETKGESDKALKHLLIPATRFSEIFEDPNSSEDLKLIVMRGFDITFSPLLAFINKYEICEHCKAKIRQLRQTLTFDQPILH